MSSFYFHIRDGVRLVTDNIGKELKSIEEARRETVILASEVRAEITKPGNLVHELYVEVEDERGKIVGRINLDKPSPPGAI